MSTSTNPPITATTDFRFMGYYVDRTKRWKIAGCSLEGEYFVSSPPWFGCGDGTMKTSCVSTAAPSIGSNGAIFYECSDAYSCITQILHTGTSVPTPDPGQLSKVACVPSEWDAYTLYRAVPATPTPSPTSSQSTFKSTSSSGAPLNTLLSSSSPTPPPSPSTVSPGIIAGATIAGVALLLVVVFLTWFFACYRRKARVNATAQQTQQYPYSEWQQPAYEADTHTTKSGLVSPGYAHHYDHVSGYGLGQSGNPAVRDAHEVGELTGDHGGR